MTTDDDDTARALIDSGFNDEELSTQEHERTSSAIATFEEATEAYRAGNPDHAGSLLYRHIATANQPEIAALRVCAAGAVALADLMVRIARSENTSQVAVAVCTDGGDDDPVYEAAEAIVNVAASGDFELLSQMFTRMQRTLTLPKLRTLVMVLVAMRGDIGHIAAEHDEP